MLSKNKKILFACVSAGVLILLTAGLWQKGLLGNSSKRLFEKIKDKPELITLFDQAKHIKSEIAKTPEKVSLYFDLGLAWKSIGELGGGELFFKESLKAYEKGIEKFGQQNILFYLNAGKLAERLKDYNKAERYYRKAMEISPADESGYLYLADLFSYSLNKPENEVLPIFKLGIKQMVNPTPLIASRASYLRRIGDYKSALEDYKVLSETFPNNSGYKEIIVELEQALKK